ncbi:MAG: class I SAM-dependent methyltransferase [Prevotella sp.]|nr:class I SAM-dependent methyltransferase [Prevotella sp.]
MEKELRPDYGNWVPKRLLLLLAVIDLVFAVLLIVAVCKEWGWALTALFAVLLVVGLMSLAYMGILYRVFSHSGGAFMTKVHEYVVRTLPWDGKGRLLDVGCGSGALTIRCARRFKEAQCTGIDYWGIKWDYSQKMCQRNAEAEGVADRCQFVHGDANHLDFADETFDAVVSNFVYHEVNDGNSKEQLLRETLRVLKKGGAFALQDLFGQKAVYGDFQQILDSLKVDAVEEIHYADSCSEIPIPSWMQVPGMLPGVGLIYGKK